MRTLWADDGAESGVGTMIIFIAMVLVSALGASLLISVALQTQEQAEDVGTQALADISTGFTIQRVVGDRNVDGNASASTQSTIQVLRVRVGLIAGSGAIDFDDVFVTLLGSDTFISLSLNATGTTAAHADGTTYVGTAVRDDDSSFSTGNVATPGDIVDILISLDEDAINVSFGTNDVLTIDITPKHGITSHVESTAPSVFQYRFVELR